MLDGVYENYLKQSTTFYHRFKGVSTLSRTELKATGTIEESRTNARMFNYILDF
jgi:hypothetical protein